MIYQCRLVKGEIVLESFYREGKSIDDIFAGLNLFQWPEGEWIVKDMAQVNVEEAYSMTEDEEIQDALCDGEYLETQNFSEMVPEEIIDHIKEEFRK